MSPVPPRRAVGAARLSVGAAVIVVLSHAYVLGIPRQGANPFDYFGFFTNLTSLLAAIVYVTTGMLVLRRRQTPDWLTTIRAIVVACMLVVGLVYNILVPGTGSAPAWVSATLHTVFPVVVMLDWTLIPDRSPRRWRHLWLVLPYPLVWLCVVLVRGVTDGWVPYGFLLPERGPLSLLAHVLGLLAALLLAGAGVWALSRVSVLRPGRQAAVQP